MPKPYLDVPSPDGGVLYLRVALPMTDDQIRIVSETIKSEEVPQSAKSGHRLYRYVREGYRMKLDGEIIFPDS